MSLAFVGITLNIRNNRTYPIRINVLGSPFNPLDTANAKTEYRWDITAFNPSDNDVLTLEYKPVGAAIFSTFTYQIYNTNIEGLINALDALGIGYFQSYTELGQLYLSTYNDNVVFGLLTITNNGTPATSTTTTTTTGAPTTSTTTTTTTGLPTTSTTTTSTTAAPTTSTTTTSTTAAPTSTTTTSTTAAPTTSTTTTTTTLTVISFNIGYLSNVGSNYTGYATGGDACTAGGTGNIVLVYSTSPIYIDGTVLYFDSALTQPFISTGGYYWASGGIGIYSYFTYSGASAGFTDCVAPTTTSTTTTTTAAPTTTTSTTTSTTTAAPAVFNLGYSASNPNDACYNGLVDTNVYYAANGSVLGNGLVLYSDSTLTTLVSNGWYSDGTNWYVVNTGNGTLTNQTACALTTTTTSTTTSTTTAPAGVSVTTVTGGWTDDGFGNFTPNCFVAINTTYPTDITFDTQVDLAGGGVYNFNTTILAGNLNGTGTGGTYGGTPTGVNNACIISCDTPAIIFSGFNCYTTQFLVNNGSLDIAVTNVIYNGSSPTFLGGQPLPNTTGNGTDLWFGFIGAYYTLDVNWSASIGGQHITVTDSLGTVQCQNVGVGSGTLSFPNVYFDGTNVVLIDVQDGTC